MYAYPWLIRQLRPTVSVDFVACSGAKTADLMASQVQAVTSSTSIVTVTIGGNDIGYANLIVQCTLGNCSTALDSTRSTLATVLGPRLLSVYAAIKAKAAPTANVVVLGYPRMFSSASCGGAFGISATERTKANQLADALDSLSSARWKGPVREPLEQRDSPTTGAEILIGYETDPRRARNAPGPTSP